MSERSPSTHDFLHSPHSVENILLLPKQIGMSKADEMDFLKTFLEMIENISDHQHAFDGNRDPVALARARQYVANAGLLGAILGRYIVDAQKIEYVLFGIQRVISKETQAHPGFFYSSTERFEHVEGMSTYSPVSSLCGRIRERLNTLSSQPDEKTGMRERFRQMIGRILGR